MLWSSHSSMGNEKGRKTCWVSYHIFASSNKMSMGFFVVVDCIAFCYTAKWSSYTYRHILLYIIFNCLLLLSFWLCWVFAAGWGLSLAAGSGGSSSLWCAGFSLQRPLLLQSMGCTCISSVVAAGRLSCCVPRGHLRPGIQLMFPALAGGLLTIGPLGKSYTHSYFNFIFHYGLS